jgi:hypothetical protein
MALMDQNTYFTATTGAPQAVTATAVSTDTYDILQGLMLNTSAGTYTVPPNAIIGNASFFGEDLGGGRGVGTPTVEVYNVSTTAPTGATSLQVQLQGAPDNGGGTISGLTFTPYIMSQVIPIASILAPRLVCAFDFPKRSPDNTGLPRFINLNYVVAGSNFANLSLNSYINLGYTQAQSTLGQYPANY